MAINTKIEWAHDTVNFWWGCTQVSRACKNCYALLLDIRRKFGGTTHWGADASRWERLENALKDLVRHNRLAERDGMNRREFINSMSDFFEDREDLDEPRLAALAAFRTCRHLDILLLTKRPQRILSILGRLLSIAQTREMTDLAQWLGQWLSGSPPANVWIGTTVENQEWADIRLDQLCRVPAAIRFVSFEPALGRVDFSKWFWRDCAAEGRVPAGIIHWVICGGESGAKAEEMLPDWARAARDQCVEADIPFHFKQWGEFCRPSQMQTEVYRAVAAKNKVSTLPEQPFRLKKKRSGRLLDGREWNGVPKAASYVGERRTQTGNERFERMNDDTFDRDALICLGNENPAAMPHSKTNREIVDEATQLLKERLIVDDLSRQPLIAKYINSLFVRQS